MIFTTPLFNLQVDEVAREGIPVLGDNSLQVNPYGGEPYIVRVRVNTALYPVFRLMGIGREDKAFLYLDETRRGGYVFGIETGDDFYDLWRYTRDKLPLDMLKAKT